MEPKLERCTKCQSTELLDTEQERTQTIGGVAFSASLPCKKCSECGEVTCHSDTLARFESAIALELARFRSCAPDAVERMRKSLHLSESDLASLLGEELAAVKAWEREGGIPIAAWAVLAAMVTERSRGSSEMRDRLLAMSATLAEHQPARVRLDARGGK